MSQFRLEDFSSGETRENTSQAPEKPRFVSTYDGRLTFPTMNPIQEEALAVVMQDPRRHGAIVNPVGSGKTKLALRIWAELKEPSLLVVVPRIVLIQNPWLQEMESVGLNDFAVGQYFGEQKSLRPITVALYQTLLRHPEVMAKFTMCVKPDTMILGDNGPISALAEGSKVVSKSGESVVRHAFVRKFEGDMVRIKAAGLLPLETTPEHPLLVSHCRQKKIASLTAPLGVGSTRVFSEPEWIPAKEVEKKRWRRKGDYLVIPRLKGEYSTEDVSLLEFVRTRTAARNKALTHLAYSRRRSLPLTPETAWLLGLYVAEGSGRGYVNFTLNERERTTLGTRVARTMEGLGFRTGFYRRGNAVDIRCGGPVLARAFKSWCGDGSHNKVVPKFVLFHNDPRIYGAFLDGYLDGDGCKSRQTYDEEKRRITATTASKALALQLQLLFARQGRAAYISVVPPKKEVYIMGVRTVQNTIYHIYLADYPLKASYMVIKEDYLLTPVRRTERIHYTGPVHNIETSDNTYLVSNAVVHNCVFDECDVLGGETYGTLLDAVADVPYVFGLTGTIRDAYERSSRLRTRLPRLVERSIADAREQKLVVGADIVPVEVSLTSEERTEYDRLTKAYTKLMSEAQRARGSEAGLLKKRAMMVNQKRFQLLSLAQEKVAAVVGLVQQHQGEPTLIYSSSVANVVHLKRLLIDDGIPCEALTQASTPWERKKVIDGFGKRFSVLLSVGVLSRGYNVPEVTTEILVGTQSTSLTAIEQRLGRALRNDPRNPGKRATIYAVVAVATMDNMMLSRAKEALTRLVRK